jgi:hypothetical protein
MHPTTIGITSGYAKLGLKTLQKIMSFSIENFGQKNLPSGFFAPITNCRFD